MTALRSCLGAVAMLLAAAFPQPPLAPQPSAFVDRLIAAGDDEARRAIVSAGASDDLAAASPLLIEKGRAFRREGDLDAAARAFLAAKIVAERRGDRLAVAQALINYSFVPGNRAEYDDSIRALDEALVIGDAIKNDDIVAASLTNLAIVYRLTGDYERAIATNRRSLSMAIAAKDRARQGRVYNNLGAVLIDQGRYREALDAFSRAVEAKRDAGDDLGVSLQIIGDIHRAQGNFDLAVTYYERAIAESQTGTSGALGVAKSTGNLGLAYQSLGRFDQARASFERALAISERAGDQRGVAEQITNIASLSRAQGRLDAALADDRRALALREKIDDPAGRVASLAAMARDLAGTGHQSDAVASAERGIALARELGGNDLVQSPLMAAGDIKRRAGDLRGAEAAYRQAIDAVEAGRAEVAGGAQSRRRYLENKLGMYHGLAATLFAEQRVADGLSAIELSRARALADILDSAGVAVQPLTPDERDRQRTLEQAVAAAARRGRTDEVRAAQLALDEFRDALDARYPVRRLARGGAQADPLALAADLLVDDRTALLEYVLAGDAAFVVVVARRDGRPSAQVFRIPCTTEELRAAAAAFSRKLSTRALDFRPDARRLYDLLIAPAKSALAGRTALVVAPDDVLWTIPFSALESPSGQPVIETASVAYMPSIAVLHAMRARRAAARATSSPHLVVAADAVGELPRIPAAAVEASALATLYGRAASRTFVGAAANEPAVRAALPGADVLHFATHGVVDDVNPMYSHLQLTTAGEGDAAHDGRLEAWEIATLKLRATVAVLTACDSGRGHIGGEGVVGLAWAFFAAGTPATVVSLWQIESTSATELTLGLHRRLHDALMKGEGRVADNLRAAALEVRSDPRYRHPFYWAGLVAVGDVF